MQIRVGIRFCAPGSWTEEAASLFKKNLTEAFENGQYLLIGRDIGHAPTVVDVTYSTLLVYEYLGRHAPESKKIHFLSVRFQNLVFWVWQAHKEEVSHFPVLLKCPGVFRTDDDHFSVEGGEPIVIQAQLRHVPAAERSQEPPVQDQQDTRPGQLIGERKGALPVEMFEREVRCLGIDLRS